MHGVMLPIRVVAVGICLLLATGCGEDKHEIPDPPGDPVESELTRDEDPDVDDPTFEEFTEDNRAFAFSVFDGLRGEEGNDGNIFISPHSISSSLAMVYAGAEGDTREEMKQALHFEFDDETLHPAFNQLDLELASRPDVDSDDGDPPQVAVVNQSWGDVTLDFVDDYLDVLAKHYGSDMRIVDFEHDHEDTRQEINHWVEEATNDRIQDLLPASAIDELTRFVLVNAIYFDADWKNEFDESDTRDQPFHLIDGTTVDVPLMRQTEDVGYYGGEDTVAVSLPYVGDELAFVAWMPADEEQDFSVWEDEFERPNFDEVVAEMSPREVRVLLPRFEQRQEFALSEVFEQLGMVEAFEEWDANFDGIGQLPEGWNLYLSEIFHQTFVDVDEEGTEAAAATGSVGAGVDSAPPPPPEVRFDRPFYYAIYDHPTDTILFFGRLMQP